MANVPYRGMTREVYHTLRRGHGDMSIFFPPVARRSAIHFTIDERSAYRRTLDRCVEDGLIGVERNGRDCDCVQYHSSYVVSAPTGAVQFQRQEDEHRGWLDGTESTYWSKPSETVCLRVSRDLALEAFEDGHPHVVYIA